MDSKIKLVAWGTSTLVLLAILFPVPEYYRWQVNEESYRNELVKVEKERIERMAGPKRAVREGETVREQSKPLKTDIFDRAAAQRKAAAPRSESTNYDVWEEAKALLEQEDRKWAASLPRSPDSYDRAVARMRAKLGWEKYLSGQSKDRAFLFDYELYSSKRPNFVRMAVESIVLILVGGGLAFALRSR